MRWSGKRRMTDTETDVKTVSEPTKKLVKVDDRIPGVLERAVHNKHRCLVALVGDESKTQVMNFHYMLSKARNETNPSVLWCMKNELSFGGMSRKKRLTQSRREISSGKVTTETHESFETFLAQTSIRYCYYKESQKILGCTFPMLVLQDFEALTPNVLARTIETVAGGGLILLMLRTMTSLRQLHTLVMEVHSKYRTESHPVVIPRFNRRLVRSFADCKNFICVNDRLEVLPITDAVSLDPSMRYVATVEGVGGGLLTPAEKSLREMKEALKTQALVGPLAQLSVTLDQAKALLTLVKVLSEKSLDVTLSMTAGRGRGKSAALGMAVAGAFHLGYSNMLVTSPSPENVATLFEFLLKGLTALGYVEHSDYEKFYCSAPELSHCIVRVVLRRGKNHHRQLLQYIFPQDSLLTSQAELVIVEEAAAIPLPMVRKLLGPYLVMMSSTISGYEGTGRSLSLKLIKELKQTSTQEPRKKEAIGDPWAHRSRTLQEIELKEPIRYALNDPIERWLYNLLCLECTTETYTPKSSPDPRSCTLHYVNRDVLFSSEPTAEIFLQRVMSLLVGAHYRNQPNDLQLLCDAPAHHLLVLTGPVPHGEPTHCDIYCVIQLCEEGGVGQDKLQRHLDEATKPSGDMIPYTLASYFLQPELAALRGLRVVRIATHSAFQRSGYGSKAMSLLIEYLRGSSSEFSKSSTSFLGDAHYSSDVTETSDASNAALFVELDSKCHKMSGQAYIGTVYGVTAPLFEFWTKCGFAPYYLRQQTNEMTAEHSLLMMQPLVQTVGNRNLWILFNDLRQEFHQRYLALVSSVFRGLPLDVSLALAVDTPTHLESAMQRLTEYDEETSRVTVDGVPQATRTEVSQRLSSTDMARMSSFTQLRVDLAIIRDLLPTLASLYFSKKLFHHPEKGIEAGVVLSPSVSAILLGVGLHGYSLEELTKQPPFNTMSIPIAQLRALLQRGIKSIVEYLRVLCQLDEFPHRAKLKDSEISLEDDTCFKAVDGEVADFSRQTGNTDSPSKVQVTHTTNVLKRGLERRPKA